MLFWPNRRSFAISWVGCLHNFTRLSCWCRFTGIKNQLKKLYTPTDVQVFKPSLLQVGGPWTTVSKHCLHKWLNLVKAQPILQVLWDWPGGMKENATALLLIRLPRSSYAHWKTYPFNARTLSTPVMVVVCFVLVRTVYTAPGKAVIRSWPLSAVPLCIHSGAIPFSLCLQMRVIWCEQVPSWSSRETLKAAVRCRAKQSTCERCISVNAASVYTASTVHIGIAS